MPSYKLDKYRLLSNDCSSESRESILRDGKDNEGLTEDEYDSDHRSGLRIASVVRLRWEKRNFMVALAISLVTNLVLGVLAIILLKSVKFETCLDSSFPEITPYGQ